MLKAPAETESLKDSQESSLSYTKIWISTFLSNALSFTDNLACSCQVYHTSLIWPD